MYHMAKNNIHEAEIYRGFEEKFRESIGKEVAARHAMGALYGYYKSGLGTKQGLDLWEAKMDGIKQDLRK